MTKFELHTAHCNIWEARVDLASLDASLAARHEPEIAHYLANAQPIYDTLGRVMAQLSGILLLYMLGRQRGELSLDHGMFKGAQDQLAGCRECLRALYAPPQGKLHYNALSQLWRHLVEVSHKLDRLAARRPDTSGDTDIDLAVQALHRSRRLFMATSAPDDQLSPVDFSHACCNCGMAKSG